MTLRRDLGALQEREHDLLIVGGGIHGAAAAWDASQRGLTVALVERADFGSGTSWNSLKTIHGGLRHLQRLDLRGLRESARERRALLRIARPLVQPLTFLVPVYGHGTRGREALAIGLRLNDLLTLDRHHGLPPAQQIPAGRMLSRGEVLDRLPGLSADGLTGGAEWTDAQVTSSERLLLAFLRAAAEAGAVLANYVEAESLLRHDGRVNGVRLHDRTNGTTFEARARLVVLAAGPFLDRLLPTAGLARPPVPLLQALNLVMARRVADVAVGARRGGRYLFIVPWRGHAIVGTDYAPAEAGPIPAARFLAEAQEAFPWAGLREADVTLVHRGRVPGSEAIRLWTRSRLLDHQADGLAGLISMVGVKYTTARALAERAVDLALRRLGLAPRPCRTAVTLLPVRERPGTLAERATAAVREEMALHLSDAVLRRLDLGTAGPPAESGLEVVAAAMAEELGWDEARLRTEKAALASFYEAAASGEAAGRED